MTSRDREKPETGRLDPGGFLLSEPLLGVCAHARRLIQRPDIGATVTADRANETPNKGDARPGPVTEMWRMSNAEATLFILFV